MFGGNRSQSYNESQRERHGKLAADTLEKNRKPTHTNTSTHTEDTPIQTVKFAHVCVHRGVQNAKNANNVTPPRTLASFGFATR